MTDHALPDPARSNTERKAGIHEPIKPTEGSEGCGLGGQLRVEKWIITLE